MPEARRGEVRLGEAQSEDRLDEARRPDARLGHGRLLLARRALRLPRRRRAARRRHGARRLRGPGHRHRHLHGAGADGGGAAGHPDRAGRGRPGRHGLPAGPVSGGSMATASLVAPVHEAVDAGGRGAARRRVRGRARPFDGSKPSDLAFQRRPHRRTARAAAGDGVRRRAAGAEQLRRYRARAPAKGTFGAAGEAEALQAFLRRALRRGHLAAGDRAAARLARGLGDRRRPHPQSPRRAQPDRGCRRDGHRHGAVRGAPNTTRAMARR